MEGALRLVAVNVEKSSKAERLLRFYNDQNLEGQFGDLAIISPQGKKTPLFGKAGNVPTLTGQEILDMRSGKSFIKAIAGPESGRSPLWMSINLAEGHPEAGILIAELKSAFVWNTENIESNEEFRVISETGGLLFASETGFDLPPEIVMQLMRTNSGQFTWKKGEEDYVGAYWKIPMKGMFSTPDMIIVQGLPEELAFAAVRKFTEVYPPIIVLAVLIVGLLSTRLITKYLKPLEQLKTVTLRIAEGDFNCRVNVESRDEFEELADSFNEMTRRLRSQFDILSTMAEIDRNILSAQNAEEIVETA